MIQELMAAREYLLISLKKYEGDKPLTDQQKSDADQIYNNLIIVNATIEKEINSLVNKIRLNKIKK